MAKTDWVKRKEDALRILEKTAAGYPLLKKAKPLIKERIALSPKAVERIKYDERSEFLTAGELSQIPYISELSEFIKAHPECITGEYLIISSDDMPAALKCGVMAASARKNTEEEANSEADFYFT